MEVNNSRTGSRLASDLLKQMLILIKNRSQAAIVAGALVVVLGFQVSSGLAQTTRSHDAESNSSPRVDLLRPLTLSWRHQSSLTLNLTPACDDERVYLPLAGGTIVSLMAVSGQLNWRSEIGGEFSASPIADGQSVYVASETGKAEAGSRRATGALRALGREGGVTQWMRTLAMPLRGSLTLGGAKLFGGSSDGKVYAFDSRNGEARWFFDYGQPFNSQPVVSGSRVYIGSEDGSLLALEESTGKLLWRYKTKAAVRGPVANGNDVVYFGSGDGYVYAVNAANGRLIWRKRTGAGVQAVVRAGEGLLVASLDNFVYKFSLAGARLWKRRLTGRIFSQPLVTHDAALFMPLSSSDGVVLELRDGRQANLLPVGEEITTSASPVAVGATVLLTNEHGLLAFTQPRETSPAKK